MSFVIIMTLSTEHRKCMLLGYWYFWVRVFMILGNNLYLGLNVIFMNTVFLFFLFFSNSLRFYFNLYIEHDVWKVYFYCATMTVFTVQFYNELQLPVALIPRKINFIDTNCFYKFRCIFKIQNAKLLPELLYIYINRIGFTGVGRRRATA